MNRKEIEEFIANFATLYKWSENNAAGTASGIFYNLSFSVSY